jgi:surface antigen
MIGKDDYPYSGDPADTPDPWQFLKRECTSFVAWRINNDLHVPFGNSYKGQWFGNAMDWAGAAQRAGVQVDGSPQVGAVAQFPPGVAGAGSLGHVAVVIGVTGASITVEDYNYQDGYDQDTMYNYSQHVVPSAGLNFLHFTGGGLTGKVEASPTLNVRSGPGPDHPVVGTVPYGGSVGISCWTRGAPVTATWQDGSTWTTDVWDRLAESINGGAGYVSDAWINTGGDTSKQTSSC